MTKTYQQLWPKIQFSSTQLEHLSSLRSGTLQKFAENTTARVKLDEVFYLQHIFSK